jgi:Tfp pilus assembly protein PilV
MWWKVLLISLIITLFSLGISLYFSKKETEIKVIISSLPSGNVSKDFFLLTTIKDENTLKNFLKEIKKNQPYKEILIKSKPSGFEIWVRNSTNY